VFDIIPLVERILDRAVKFADGESASSPGADGIPEKEVAAKLSAARDFLKKLPLAHLTSDSLQIEVDHAKVRLARLRTMAGEYNSSGSSLQ
jgi:hypothetical protein